MPHIPDADLVFITNGLETMAQSIDEQGLKREALGIGLLRELLLAHMNACPEIGGIVDGPQGVSGAVGRG
jgi:hypothetical protein